jgi:protein-S-isoprenylcysteine O-methyltransferase Ste14
MDDARPELARRERGYARRWWPGPQAGHWPDAMQMAVPVAAAALLTVCAVGLALVLDSHDGGRWAGPVVFGLAVVTLVFYGWAIYSAVHPLPTARSRIPRDVVDLTGVVAPAPEAASDEQGRPQDTEPA